MSVQVLWVLNACAMRASAGNETRSIRRNGGFVMITGARQDGSPLEVGFRYDPDADAYLILHALPARSKYLRP